MDQWSPPTLGAEATHHLLSVIRLHPGERAVLFDGKGQQALSILREIANGIPSFELLEPLQWAQPEHRLHLFLAMPKGPAMDDAVRMATEAGMTDLHPLISSRSVAKGERGDRWARIAESAAQQCGRGDIPTIHPIQTFSASLAQLQEIDRRIALPGAPPATGANGPAAVWIGPEGGFSPEEVKQACAAGLQPMGIGRWIFRAETAAAVAVSAMASADAIPMVK